MIVRPLSTVDNTRGYAHVSHSRQWSNYNTVRDFILLYFLLYNFNCGESSCNHDRRIFVKNNIILRLYKN